MNPSGESIRVVHPLFQTEGGGSTPTSPLQLQVGYMSSRRAMLLNSEWHSRLPEITNWQTCIGFGAHFDGVFYAVALWGDPIARAYNGKNYLELRRMAIAPNAPKNTGSRMLAVMRSIIKKTRPKIVRLLSYQDTAVHKGTIYKAAGWHIGGMKKNIVTGWQTRNRPTMQTLSDKIRWELNL